MAAVSASTLVVEVLELTRVFPPRIRSSPLVTVLDAVSFAAPWWPLTGPNGAGKTIALDVVAMLRLPTSGDVRIDGASVLQSPADVRRHVAYCPSGRALFWPRLTSRENLECFAALAGMRAGECPRRLPDAADRVGLSADLLSRQTRTYSDGQLQRLNFARSCAT